MADPLRDWDVASAVYWIAFRGTPPVLLQHSEQQDDAAPVIEALRARAAGNPRSWKPPPDTLVLSAWRTRALARRWMRAEGITAAEMLEKATSDNPRWVSVVRDDEHGRRISEALRSLNVAAAQGDLQAWARHSSTWTKPDNPQPRHPLPQHYVDETRQISLAGDLSLKDEGDGFTFLRDRGIRGDAGETQCFYDIVFRAADLQRLWPSARLGTNTAFFTAELAAEVKQTVASEADVKEWLHKQVVDGFVPPFNRLWKTFPYTGFSRDRLQPLYNAVAGQQKRGPGRPRKS